MSLPIQCIPPDINKLFLPYKKAFNKSGYNHFKHLVTGLAVSDNKTLQEINDAFGKRDQSNFNRFVTKSKWDIDRVNKIRINQAQKSFNLDEYGALIVDESLLHKTGKKMELAGIHRSGVTKKKEWGHMTVNSIYYDLSENKFPIKTDIYVRKKDCKKNNLKFKTKREIALEQMRYSLEQGIPNKISTG